MVFLCGCPVHCLYIQFPFGLFGLFGLEDSSERVILNTDDFLGEWQQDNGHGQPNQ